MSCSEAERILRARYGDGLRGDESPMLVSSVERAIDARPCDSLTAEDCEHHEAPTPPSGEQLYPDEPDDADRIGDRMHREGHVPIICHVADEVHFAPADMKPIPHVTCPTSGCLEWARESDWSPETLARWGEFEAALPGKLLEPRRRVTTLTPLGTSAASDVERLRRDTAQRCLLEFLDSPGEAADKVRAAVRYADLLVAELARPR